MSKTTGRLFPFGLGVLAVAAVVLAGTTARADVSIEESGSVIIFAKILNGQRCVGGSNETRECTSSTDCTGGGVCVSRDTTVQISNTGNTLVHAHCFYTDAQPVNRFLPPGPLNPPRWQETDFFIWLTKQQPTHWTVSKGRPLNPFDDYGKDGFGIDPGAVPPVFDGFMGELVCVEVGADGLPVSGNKLKGEASLIDTDTGDVSKYAAIAIQAGASAGATGRELRLDGDEYSSCPNVLLMNHFADGTDDPVISDFGACTTNCPITTELTLVPCQRDYENQVPGSATVHFQIFNEFEQAFSTDTAVDCWFNAQLSNIGSGIVFEPSTLGTLTAYSRISPSGESGGLLGVVEETHTDSSGVESRAAFSLQIEGSRFQETGIVDTIVLTGE